MSNTIQNSDIFCHACGKSINASAKFCPSCGVVQSSVDGKTQKMPEAGVETIKLSKTWQKRFDVIEKAGGAKLPRLGSLTFGERWCVYFNFLAILFGPFYYLAKGMWRKAITYTAIAVLLTLAVDALSAGNIWLNSTGSFICGFFANVDYYRRVRLQSDLWLG